MGWGRGGQNGQEKRGRCSADAGALPSLQREGNKPSGPSYVLLSAYGSDATARTATPGQVQGVLQKWGSPGG